MSQEFRRYAYNALLDKGYSESVALQGMNDLCRGVRIAVINKMDEDSFVDYFLDYLKRVVERLDALT
jgi:hypothetical protein